MYELEKTTSKPASIIFYLLVVNIGALFLVNLFLAVLFDSFSKQQEAEDEALAVEQRASAQLEQEAITAAAKEAADKAAASGQEDVEAAGVERRNSGSKFALLKGKISPEVKDYRQRSTAGFFANVGRHAESMVYGLIVLNTLAMCGNYYGESEEWVAVLYMLNVIFTSAFFLEMVLKLCTR